MLVSKQSKNPLSIRQIFTLVKDVGKVAAEQFTDNPLKQQKLLRLSPHWLRHLLASHLAKANVPSITIQSILRHSSLDITNIYMHAEELLRHQEIQKLTLQVNPKLAAIEPAQKTQNVSLVISLNRGPVSNEFSLLKLLDTIEQVILQAYSWEAQAQNRELLLTKYKQLYSYKQPLVITYSLWDIKEEEVNVVRLAIMREASIRLFNCEIVMDF